jgi:threonine dehydrogenase-like Zn-dependent dehydrogenase
MKQVAQNYKSGELLVVDVPPPACKPGGVLVGSLFSLISTGTEMTKVDEAKLSLLGKARARPDQLRKVVDTAAQVGPIEAYKRAVNRLDSLTPLGYSLCGVVIEVGRGADEFAVGQVVACAGNEHALHAEVNWVPTNLCVPVGPGVRPEHAAFATVGAIAMQGVRRAEVQLGESACVIGLGLVGQLTVQLLVAAGVNVVGFDPVVERCRIAEAAGAIACAAPDAEGIEQIEKSIAAANGGLGADHVLITAAGESNDPVHIAARVARDRARIVDVGKCRLDLPWNAYYDKELDIRFSRSYGPGRYDDRYELEGVDYPAGYVRWTERRNLACFVDLLERDALHLDLLVSATFPVAEAAAVYARIAARTLPGIGFLFEYPDPHAARGATVHGAGERSARDAAVAQRRDERGCDQKNRAGGGWRRNRVDASARAGRRRPRVHLHGRDDRRAEGRDVAERRPRARALADGPTGDRTAVGAEHHRTGPRRGDRASRLPAHARNRPVHRTLDAVGRRHGRAHRHTAPRPRRGVGRGRARARAGAHDRRRRLRPAVARGARE